MKIYFIRHGQSVANTQKIIAGDIDSPLTPKGLVQANKTAKIVVGLAPDMIISSKLKRAVQTSNIIAEQFELAVDRWTDLKEVHYGDCQGQEAEEGCKTGLQLVERNQCLHAESLDEMRERANHILDKIKNLEHVDRLFVVGHSTFTSIIFGTIKKLSEPELVSHRLKWEFDNAGVKEISYTKEKGFEIISE